MSTRQTKKLRAIHTEALKAFDREYLATLNEREQSVEDRRFCSIAGAQWEGSLGEQFENKPKFEINKVHLSIIRIVNEYRNNRISVKFISKEGNEEDSLADTCNGLYRADEQDSVSEEAYDNAFEEAVSGGFGAWRVLTKYEHEDDPEDERQRICIEPIFDADTTVFFDSQAKRQDKGDAKYCFVITPMSVEAFEEEYDDNPSTWQEPDFKAEYEWVNQETVWIAEYYKQETVKTAIHIWEDLGGIEHKFTEEQMDDDDFIREQEAKGFKEVRVRMLRKKQIRKYILSGNSVLEDTGFIAGDLIPIVPVFGKRWVIGGIERFMGHVRLAKDAQRIKNVQISKLAELSSTGSTEKPILTPEQVAGHEVMWSKDNVDNYPYLLVNPIMGIDGSEIPSGPIGYTKAPEIPVALASLLNVSEQDMQDLLGNQQNSEDMSGSISTETAHLIQGRLDMQTYIYMSNMARAMRRCGAVWLSMAKDVLVEEGRKMKMLGSQDEVRSATLATSVIAEDGTTQLENDLKKADFDVMADVGPSSSTRKASTVRSLTQVSGITDDPETKQVINAMIMMNMEGEGVEEVREFFRKKLLSMGVLDPTEKEAKEMQEKAAAEKPSANDQYALASAEAEKQRGAKAVADAEAAIAKAEKTRVETAEVASNIDIAESAHALQVVESLTPDAPEQ